MSKTDVVDIKVWTCGRCGDLHQEKEDAETCCPGEYSALRRYECPHCNDLHDSRSEAEDCCIEDEQWYATCTGCGDKYEGNENGIDRARKCCMEVESKRVFKCVGCGTEHSESTDAGDCCRETPTGPKIMYECKVDGIYWADVKSAEACCK